MGRRPVGAQAMTSTERSQRARQNEDPEKAAKRREADRLRAKARRDAKKQERLENPPDSDEETERKAYNAEKKRQQRAAKAEREKEAREAAFAARRDTSPEETVDLTVKPKAMKTVLGHVYAVSINIFLKSCVQNFVTYTYVCVHI